MTRSDRKVEAEENANSLPGWWAFTIIYCTFAFTFFLFSVSGIRDFMTVAITGSFALFGVVFLVAAIRMSLGVAKFGDLQLLLEDPAPAVGGRLTALVPLPPAVLKTQSVAAKLTCYKVTPGRKGGLLTEDFWAQTVQFPIVRTGRGGVVKISMAIPAAQQPTRMPESNVAPIGAASTETYWKWDLQLTADVPGLDLDRTFAVTVRPAQPGAALAATMPAAQSRKEIASAATNAAASSAPDDLSSLWVLVTVNLVPIAGVVFWGWRVHEIVFLYWIENLVIGAVNILRMWTAVPGGMNRIGGIGGFIMSYGVFCYVHGIFLASMFPAAEGGRQFNSLGDVLGPMLMDPYALIAIGGIAVSHAYSYFHNYIGGGEYLHADVGAMMTRPYKRIGVTQVFIIAGGFAMEALHSPLLAMVLFVGLKIAFDVYFHRKERELSAGN